MSRYGEKKDTRMKNGAHSSGNYDEGTAARTRPLSFDEIMIRRENKSLSDVDEEGKVAKKVLGDNTIENVSDPHESEKHHAHNKDSSLGADKKFTKEFSKVYTRRKKGNSHKKDDDTGRQKDKHNYDSEIKIKDKVAEIRYREIYESEMKGKDKIVAKQTGKERHESESKLKTDVKKDLRSKDKDKVEKQDPGRGKNYERSRYDVEDQAAKKHTRDSTGKVKHEARSGGKSERDSKRKHRTEDGENHRDKNDPKKRDVAKGRDVETSVGKKVKESPKSHHETSKLKRRRSRSREHDERNRKSVSPTSRAHKRTSHLERGHEDMSSHFSKGKAGRQHSDDRNRVASNGSSGHYRRHGGSTSGLGGYSPRKRKTEAAAKTPSPINRSPEKKSAKWDIAPAESNSPFASSVQSSLQTLNKTASSSVLPEGVNTNTVTSNAANALTEVSYNTSSSKQHISIESVQLTQATRPLRRLSVENIPPSTSEKALIEFFNNFLLSSGVNYVHGSVPCISCHIQKEKGQALVEFLTPEDASAALSFDGCSFSGSILRIKRPKDFNHVASGESKKLVPAVAAIGDIVRDSPNKIFIAGISKTLSSKMVMEIVSAFGPLKSYHFETSDSGEPRAFLEYMDQTVTLKACAGLNGLKLGGQTITAVQAFPNGPVMDNNGDDPFYGIPEHAIPLLKRPTEVLMVKNVFNPEGILCMSELEVEEVLEDVRLECARFGTVKSINVVRNSIQTSEACEPNENKASAEVEHLRRCNEIEEAKPLDEVINHHHSRGAAGLEFSTEAKEVKEVSILGRKSSNADKPTEEVAKESVQPHSNQVEDSTRESPSRTFPGEVLEQSNVFKVDEDKDVENKLPAEEKNQDCTVTANFEVGSVLVEFRRTEASSNAAHCLHGRLFDDRVVTVEYVPLNIYKAKFPK